MTNKTKNLLLQLKNASINRKSYIIVNNYSKNLPILENLYEEGFIQSYKLLYKSNKILIYLRYYENKPVFNNLRLLGTVLTIKNIKLKELAFFFNRKFVLFLSTNKGY